MTMKCIHSQYNIKIVLTLFLMALGSWAYTIPFTGGDLSYKRIKTGVYEFTLVLERDCGRYAKDFDFEEKVVVGAFNLQNELIGECGENGRITLQLQSVTKKRNNLSSACVETDAEECREIAIYKGTTNVPISAYGYQFVYSECCRPDNITNLLDPLNTGFTLIATLTLNGYLWYTSTPVFSNDDPLFSCIGEENTFNPGVTVKEHEEYRFSLCNPFDGKAPLNPNQLPDAPPYDHVQYKSGYSAQSPLGEDGDISIDPTTGVITYTGTKAGSYSIAICVDQYKKGRLVGTNIHEIQLNFTDCSGQNLKADFDYTVDFCNPGRVSFENLSEGADSFEWRFYSDENTSSTSTNLNPVMTFQSPGSYLVELAIANEEGCVDTARKVVEVYDFAEDIDVLNFGNCDNLTQELSLDKDIRNYEISWFIVASDGTESHIGSGAEISHTFPSEGVYDIKVVAEAQGCEVTATRQIDVNLGVTVIQDTIVLCSPDIVSLNPNSSDRYTYEWLIDSLVEDINDPNPRVFVNATTLFPVRITDKTDATCTGEGFVLVTVGESLVADFEAVQDLCTDGYTVSFSATTEGISNVHWTFVIGSETIETDEANPVITFPAPGYYTVALAGDTDSGCSAAGSRVIEVFEPATDIGIINFGNCQNYEQLLKLDKNITGYDINWFLIDGESVSEIGTGSQITYDFGAEGTYTVRAEVSNENCTIEVEEVLNVELGVTVPQDTIDLCIGSTIQLNPVAYEGYIYQWLHSSIEDENNPSPVVSVTETTRFEVVVTDRNDPDCVDTGFVWVRIGEILLADYSSSQDLCAEELTVSFQPLAADVAEANWVFYIGGKTIESTEFNPSITFPGTGFYEVQLSVVTSQGCEETFSRQVEVFDPVTDLGIVNFGNCVNYDQALLINKNIDGYEITWFLVEGENETEIGTGSEINYDFGAEGTYTVKAVISNEDCTIEVEDELDVELGVTVPQDTIDLCAGGSLQLNPMAYAGYQYQWLNSDLIDDVNAPSPTVEVTETTRFEVIVTDADDPDCVDTGFVWVRINEMDLADFVAMQDLCADGYVVHFRPASDDVIEVEWIFNIGGLPVRSTELNPTIQFNATGYYEVSLAVVTSAGCVDTLSRVIEVYDPATDLGILNFGNCQDYSQVLKLDKIVEGYDIVWTLIDGDTETEIGTGNQITYDFGAEGNYTVRAEISDDQCTIVVEDILNVVLGVTVPEQTIDLCIGGTVTLNPVSYEGYDYEWLNTELIDDSSNPSPMVTVDATTRFEVIVTDKNDPTCVDTGFVWVRINELPVADFSAVYDICNVDKTVGFQPVRNDLISTTWFFDSNDPSKTSSLPNPEFTFEAFGTYEVTLIAESAQGCLDTMTRLIEVDDLFANLDFTTNGGCEGLDYTLELNDPSIGYDVNWYLDKAGELTPIGQGVALDYTFEAPGLYDIRVELSNDECARSFVRRLQVTDGIEAPDTTIVVCEPGLIALNPFGRNDLDYTWTPSDNLDDATSYNPVANISGDITYQVTVETQDGDQVCSATGQVEIILHTATDTIPFDTTTLTICEGDLVFLNEGGDSSLLYYWQPESFFEDSRVVNPSTRLFTSQEFTVTITDPVDNCSVSFRKRVNVVPIEDNIEIDYAFNCGETSAAIVALNVSEGTPIEWTLGDSVISTETTFNYDFGSFGTFEVTARLINECAESSALITLINPDDFLFLDTIYQCEPGNVTLNPEGDTSLIYTWIGPNLESNDVASPTAFVETNSIYSAIIQHPRDTACQTSGRVYVFVESDADIIIADQTEFCMGDTASLSVSDGGMPMNVQWSDPDGVLIGEGTTIEFEFEKMGEYTVVAEIRGCIFMDTIQLQFRNVEIVASQTDGICPGDEVMLEIQFNTQEAYDSIVWQPSDVAVSSSDPAFATYTPDSNSVVTALVYFSDGCLSMDTIMLTIPPSLEDLSISADRDTLIRGQKATLTASNTGFESYRWEPADYVDFPNQAQTEVIPETTTTFTLTAVDENGCSVERTITIVVINPQCEPPYIFVPRAFSPNSDGVNDILYVRGESIDEVEFIIYDRWGQKLFETDNLERGWDGTFQGKPLPPDVYGYYLNVICIGGDTYTEKGNVTIIR